MIDYDAELRAYNERLRAAVAVRPGDRVLDIGCGAGQTTREAAHIAAPGRVLGVDVSAEMLDRARALAAAARLDYATYEQVGEERELLRAVGGAAALALESARLDAQLRASVQELRASRARLVESTDAARRRIERDVHDGAQQQLVALALALALALQTARSRLDRDPEAAGVLLEVAMTDLDGAMRELRELARGIHPAVLSDRGLGPGARRASPARPGACRDRPPAPRTSPRAGGGGPLLRARRGAHEHHAVRPRNPCSHRRNDGRRRGRRPGHGRRHRRSRPCRGQRPPWPRRPRRGARRLARGRLRARSGHDDSRNDPRRGRLRASVAARRRDGGTRARAVARMTGRASAPIA
jgi:SAM-dependent methyltransferase